MTLEHLLHEAVLILGGAVIVVLVAARLRIPPLVGLLITGMVIGPSGLGWVAQTEEVEAFAEIGVALLLFAIGLELSLGKLKELRRPFLVGGSIQAAITAILVGGGAAIMGQSAGPAIFFGCAVALSSTAIVLKLLDERREGETPHGQMALGILLFQDFLIVPFIVLTPVLAGAVPLSLGDLALRFGGSLAVVGLVVVAARRILPSLFLRLARTRARETFVLGALFTCLAMAWLTHELGFSLALGAFLAGLIVSETEYSHQVVADVGPFRDLLSSVFFISIGMLVDLSFAASHLPAVLGLALAILVVKSLVAGGATGLCGFPHRTRLLAGLALAQVGEFSFVLMEVGREYGLLNAERFQLLLAAAVVTILATPYLMKLGPVLARRWMSSGDEEAEAEGDDKLSGHVVVVGYGVGGKLLARELREVSIPYVVVELNAERVRQAKRAGERIHYGDATRAEILLHAGVERAEMVVFVISDAEALRHCVELTRRLNPNTQILVRSRRSGVIDDLQQLGADQVVAEDFETAIEIFTRVLRRYRVPRNVIRAQTRVLRGEGYAMLRAPALTEGVSEAVLEALAAGTTDLYRLDADSPAVGQSLRDLDLRRRTGATVIAVVRGETPHPSPLPDTLLESGDTLVLVGSHEEIDRAFEVLGGEEAPSG
jgi:CPA2 family monovalent cation:H+ antiporter-2